MKVLKGLVCFIIQAILFCASGVFVFGLVYIIWGAISGDSERLMLGAGISGVGFVVFAAVTSGLEALEKELRGK